jgi:predicted Zn-dependent protease
MQITKTHKIIASAVIVIILLGIYITFDRKSKQETDNKISSNEQPATTTDSSLGQGTDGVIYKIEPVSNNTQKKIPVPDLDRAVTKSALAVNVSENDTLIATKKIKELQTLLKSNPGSYSNWLDLASYQKMAGDYDGAIISWKYVGTLFPKDHVSLGNLGDLYAYYMKDNAQAELSYKEAISRAPTQSYLYTQLAQVYLDVFNSKNKAQAIINEGLKKIPNDPVLLEFQASLQ